MFPEKETQTMHSPEDIQGAKELAGIRMKLAREDLEAAEDNYRNGRYRAANNRSYYAIYHAVCACLALSFESYKQHGQTMGAFNKRYVHTGIFPEDTGKKINRAMLVRHASDYDDYYMVSDEESQNQLYSAREIVSLIGDYLSGTDHD